MSWGNHNTKSDIPGKDGTARLVVIAPVSFSNTLFRDKTMPLSIIAVTASSDRRIARLNRAGAGSNWTHRALPAPQLLVELLELVQRD
jgi:hypothetical protein